MDPGQDCLACHRAGGAAADLAFSVAGTVFTEATASDAGLFGAEVDVIDVNHRTLALQTNGAGNFYTAERLVPPFQITLKVAGTSFPMAQQAPSGSCNFCHALSANADGSQQSITVDAGVTGYARPPGHLYGFSPDAGCSAITSSCPAVPPSYGQQVEAILEGSCFPCHGPGGTADSWPLDTRANVISVGASSNALQVAGCRMPPAGSPPMSPEELETLLSWLACGAPNN